MTVGRRALRKIPKETFIAVLTLLANALHLVLRYAVHAPERSALLPLYVALLVGGAPLVLDLFKKLIRREFGSDLLAGISILTSVVLGQYLVGAIVVLMLSGGAALEQFATARASSVLDALARRMPSVAHRKEASGIGDVKLAEIRVGDALIVLPHEICPVDGVVTEGHGRMDEAYLTGEPYEMAKTPGSQVISGAINGDAALTIRAEKLAVDSRYARIMRVMQESEQQRPHLRRLGDQLGAWYTPIALGLAAVAGVASGEAHRFLAVVVVATPCPLLIAIPTAVIGAISVAARRAIIIKNPAVLEEVAKARTLFVGDGINDAPALTAATVGVAFGSQSDIITEAADAVILEMSLGKIDELMHIGRRMRRIALQSAVGGMLASIVGMIAAAFGYLPPIGGAIAQEVIDLAAVLNAVRVALPTGDLQDF